MTIFFWFELGISIFLGIFFLIVIIFMIQGGPYVPTDDAVVLEMLAAAGSLKGKRVADLGSGDGRIVIAAAKKGAIAHGFEINPKLVFQSRKKIRELGLEKNAKIYLQNMWKADCSVYDIIFLYQIKHSMPWLEKKLQKELKKGSLIVSNYFQFPDLPAKRKGKRVLIYTT